MKQVELKVGERAELGTAACRRLRRKGLIPCVLYGKQQDAMNLSVRHEDLDRVLRSGSRMVTLELAGRSEHVLLKEVQYNYLGDEVIHVDFARVALDEKIEIEVPLLLKGTPKGIEEGGVLEHNVHQVTVSCLPAHIPENITLNVADLELNQVLRLRDVKAPDGVQILGDGELAVAAVHPPTVAPEPEAVEAAAPEAAEPELIGRKEEEAPEGEAADKEEKKEKKEKKEE